MGLLFLLWKCFWCAKMHSPHFLPPSFHRGEPGEFCITLYFSIPLCTEEQPCRIQNLNRAATVFSPVSGWHALVLQDIIQLLLFSRNGYTPVNGEILPKTSFFSRGLWRCYHNSVDWQQCKNIVIVWLDFLKNTAFRITA